MTATIPLSPIDHVFTGVGAYPLEFVFAYEGTIDPGRLESSLRRTLEAFPPAGSRLARQAERYLLEPCAAGCEFETRVSHATFAGAASRAEFVAPVETLEGQPLMRVRLTRTTSGSVLGVALSHAVADGFSYFHLLASWSRVFRGEAPIAPSHERARLDPPAGCAPGSLGPESLREASGLFLDVPRAATPRERLSWTRRVFTRAELSALLAEAQAGCPVRLSYNDVVAAWLWREHVPSWAEAIEGTTWLSCPVDVRRLLPGFPASYFGCAVALANASIERERLRGASLAELARLVRDAVAGVDERRMARALAALDALRERQGLAALERLHVVHPRAGLLVTNLSRLPVREVVFDAGPPVGFDILVPAERCAVVLPAGDGLDVRVCRPVAGPP
jgi:hypothetical protein